MQLKKHLKKNILANMFFLLLASFAYSQNVEFTKSNFSKQKAELQTALDNINKGDSLVDIGDLYYKDALQYYLKANDFNPNNGALNYKIGSCYLNTNQLKNAIQYCEKALTLDKNIFYVIYFDLGTAYQLDYQFEKAILNYQEFLKKIPQKDKESFPIDVNRKIQECNTSVEMMKTPVNVDISNIGGMINSEYNDYGPIVNADESMLIFTSRRNNTTGGQKDSADSEYFEDIYISYNDGKDWSAAKNPSEPLNSNFHDAVVGMSPDGQRLFLYKGDNGGDIFECKLEGLKWSVPKPLDTVINSPYHEASASVSFDGKTIFFDSDRNGGYGGQDLYMVSIDKNGKYGKPVNLGPDINTPYNEEGVFMLPDGKTLYFCSNGHNTMGGYDIFKTVFENGKWSKPENLGYPINTPKDDKYFSISANGKHGYYSSEKEGGKGGSDIYLIYYKDADKPLADNKKSEKADTIALNHNNREREFNSVAILKGRILDDNQLPINATIEIIDPETKEVIAVFQTNSATGNYMVTVPSGKKYNVNIKADNYIFHSENFDTDEPGSSNSVKKNISLHKTTDSTKIAQPIAQKAESKPVVPVESNAKKANPEKTVVTETKQPKETPSKETAKIKEPQIKQEEAKSKTNILKLDSIVFTVIYFDFGKTNVNTEYLFEMKNIIDKIKQVKDYSIILTGYTDSIGNYNINKAISDKRAKNVCNEIVKCGVDKNKIKIKAMAFSNPVASNNTEEGRKKNRRVEIKITK